MAEASDRSQGAINFPAEYAECYAFLQSSVYGAAGKFYDQTGVIPWMPKGLVKTDNVQVNHVAGRGENTLCVAFMNECDRELRDVTVKLALPAGNHTATLWRNNQREATKLTLSDGTCQISLSAKGITALVIEGVPMQPSFQSKFVATGASAKAITHQVLQTPFGEAHAMILSFGPDLTWLYAYLTCDAKTLKSAKLNLTLAGSEQRLTDDAFPFEFSVPLKPTDTTAQLIFEEQTTGGQTVQSELIRLGEVSAGSIGK